MTNQAWVLEQECEVSSMETPKTNQYGISCDDATTKTAESSQSSLALDGTSIHSLGAPSVDRWPERDDTKVKFDSDNLTKIHWVPPRSDLSAEEFKEVWLGASDYSRISSWNRMTVKMMRQQGTLDEEPEHCSRGLEHRLKGQQRLRQTAKTNAIYGVLHEQSRQRGSESSVQRIADIYRGYAFGSDEEAKQKGDQDEMAAKEFFVRPSRQLRRQSALATSTSRGRIFDQGDSTETRPRRQVRRQSAIATSSTAIATSSTAIAVSSRIHDEDDSSDLRALINGGEDEVDASKELIPLPKGDDDKSSFEEKVKKQSKVKRLSRFLKKIGSKQESKSEQPCRSSSPIPPPPTRRLRRSSM